MQTVIEKCPSRVIAERVLDEAEVGIVDYHWKESFIYQDKDNSIHYRLMPFHLDIHGAFNGGSGHHMGNVSLLPAGSALRVFADGRQPYRARTLKCSFAPSWIERLLGQRFDASGLEIDNFLGLKNSNARACLHRIALELLEPGLASSALIESLLQTAVIEIIRDTGRLSAASFDGPRSNSTRLSSAQLDRIAAMVEDGHGRIPSAAALAHELGMSVSHFRRRFRATTGQSVHEFISASVVEHAKSLLANSHLSMKEISYRLGFTSPSSFSVAFKRVVGCSPSWFRLQAQA
ncbi:helix-turn-helix transcriptional regulator [Rhizorhabdus dicambivorans]|uniref:AraC family transcriptional regulator n=1 Tax=Rhizorhabdus dicambivorans TaxID=1850238 RepID=A0A2A4FXJ2_9SPHN|nr:AraC family transcriptional regulator [Rhizorhabdus dicambivorans]ATE65820.1 AraC family transcriptional regulator [Rhizorhabdus dicambivorans]PCE42933.1 AraC family transcriptional regulator [Rhizorhabdus dicambivorans]